MAKKEREEVELAFNLELDSRKAARGLALIEKTLRKTVARKVGIQLDGKSLNKFKKESREYKKELGSIQKVIREVGGEGNFQKATASLDKLQKAQSKFKDSLREMNAAERKFKKKMAKADNDLVKEQLAQKFKVEQRARKKNALQAQRELAKERRAVGKDMSGGAGGMIFEKHTEMAEKQRKSAEQKEQAIADLKGYEVGKELGAAFGESIERLAGRDLLGFAKGGAKMSAEVLKGAGKWGMKFGRDMQIKGHGMGGMTGKALVGLGGLSKSLGPLIATLSKLGPILGGAAAIFGSIVKLILDVEAAAKEMNKQILEGASAAETFAASGRKAGDAYKNLDSTLDRIRAEATSLENVRWGLKAEDIIRVTNTMAQQGVSLESLKKDFEHAGKAADASARQVKGFGDMARMSFAYSRLMGVSLQEITDFQAEMFTEMGQSLSGMQLQFARMTKDATESGIATNKFFSILRGVSSDLGLYTTRVGQAASMLKLLGKAMNPREAQKFMSVATQGFKQMGEEDRIRMTLLAGEGKMRDIVAKDLDRKTKLLYADIARGAGLTFDEVLAEAKKGAGALDAVLSKVGDNQRGALKSALTEVQLDRQAMQKGGTVGTSEAAANLSAAGALEATKAALQRFGGGKKLKDMTGIQAFAARKAANVSLDQFRTMVKLEESVGKQREEMKAALDAPTKDNAALRSRLEALGITQENITKKSDADIIAAMESSDQEALVEATEQKDYAQKTSELTTTLVDKMGIVIDGIFNYIYVALKDVIHAAHGIIDWLSFGFGKGKGPDYKGRLESKRNDSNSALIDALKVIAQDSDPELARKNMIRTVEQSVVGNWGNASKDGNVLAKVSKDLGKIFEGESEGSRGLQANAMLGFANVDKEKKGKFMKSLLGSGGNFGAAIKDAGLTPEEIQMIYRKALSTIGKDEIEKLADLDMMKGAHIGAPSVAQAQARSKDGQQASSAKAQETSAASSPLVTKGGQIQASPITGTTVGMPSEGKVVAEQLDFMGRENVQSLQNLYDALRRRGVVFDKQQLNSDFKEAVKQGTLAAMREALMEFAMYTAADPSKTLQRMKDSGFQGVSAMAGAMQLPANADGGRVIGVTNGRAVFAPPGEGLASIGPGEKISPAKSGGGGSVNLHVHGMQPNDFSTFLKKRVAEAIYEYKRREKFQ
jgi:uncharacterized membrane-anchored protein YhcB (DUF1043 family)